MRVCAGDPTLVERLVLAAAAGLAVLGFLAYYLPVYLMPHAFPAASVTLPRVGGPVRVPWGELSWAVLLTTVELLLLTLLNLVGVHEIAVATGFLTPETKSDRTGALLSIGLERKSSEVTRYGIDPFHVRPGDYLKRFATVSSQGRTVRRALILAGFILDGHLSWRERLHLRRLNRVGILSVRAPDVRRQVRAFLSGGGLPLDGRPT